jgi:hypothetical protein
MEVSAQDVALVLQRLSQTAAARGLGIPDGVTGCTAEELQQRWSVVAGVAGNGYNELDPMTIEHLKVVYNYIETVIISCGAPDSFDVYEVCFETLSKMGFFLQSATAKELLFKCLEDVHEVYDVLLSCVETYEWVQPGATNLLRLWMLQVLFACFGYNKNNITGRTLMELTDNDVQGAISLISFMLRCSHAPFEMQSAAGRCLVELTTADAVFLSELHRNGSEADWQNQAINQLTGMLNRHVNGLIKGIIQYDVVEAFGRCICQHQMSHYRTDVIVRHFLTTIHNCLLYCSENQKKLRQHLATQSTVVQDIMVPYVHNILPALYDQPAAGPQLIEWQNLKSVLQTFVVVTFNINVFRPQLRDVDTITKIFDVPNILSHISMLELLVKLAINVDFARGPFSDAIAATLRAAFDRLPVESQKRLQRRMTSEQSMRLPYAKTAVKAVELLQWCLVPPAGEETKEMQVAVAQQNKFRKKEMRMAKNKQRKKKKLFNQKQGQDDEMAQPLVSYAPEEQDSSDDDDDMPPLVPADNWEPHLGTADQVTQVPSKAVCELTGAMMCDPVITPDGHLFERAAIEDWMTVSASNPRTGAPLSMEECQSAKQIQDYIQSYQMQMMALCEIAPEAFEQPREQAAPAAQPGIQKQSSLLGDLPNLGQDGQQAAPSAKKEKNKIKITSRTVVECPEDMRCAIDGKVCINPVRSPYGHLFEKKTLERWFANCGSVCPVSNRPLRLEDCQPDSEMKKRIVRFLKNQDSTGF